MADRGWEEMGSWASAWFRGLLPFFFLFLFFSILFPKEFWAKTDKIKSK